VNNRDKETNSIKLFEQELGCYEQHFIDYTMADRKGSTAEISSM